MEEPVSPRLFGARVKRVEDPRLLRGDGRYLADLWRPGTLHAAVLRSPHAHARIVRVDLASARQLPGVQLVLGGREALSLVCPFQVPLRADRYHSAQFPHLAHEKVRFDGEPVALIVADDAYLARDALDLIHVEYEPLPPVVDAELAVSAEAPRLHDELPSNVLFEHESCTGDPERAFAEAEVVVEETFRHGRQTGLAMENRGVLAVPAEGRLTVWTSTQVPFTVRRALATALGLELEAIRVRTPDVGGGFGTKAQVYAEEMLVPLAARLLDQPVLWAGDRLEDLRGSTQARSQVLRVALAARRDGVITALRADVLCDVGAYGCHPYGPALEALGTPSMLPGPYRIEHYSYRTRAVCTNKAPEGAYRGVGIVLAAFVHERLLDLLAARLGLDPAEARRRNFVSDDAFPYQTSGGLVYDSGSFGESLDLVLRAADYPALRREQAAARQRGRLLGIGLGCYTEYTGLGSAVYRARGMELIDGREGARVSAGQDGTIRVAVSLPSIGQGLATTLGQLAAEALELTLERVQVPAPDSDETPPGSGTFASRGAVVGGGAVQLACDGLKEQACQLGAELLEASRDDVQFRRGGVELRGAPDRRLELAELVTAGAARGLALTAARHFDPPGTSFANGAHLAVVEVDAETGLVEVLRYVVVEDCGKVINPAIVDGQVQGAVAQGIGGALLEELYYDEQGQLQTGSLLDYLIPGAIETPGLEIHHLESPAPHSLHGVKGVGEGGTVGAPAAIANAVADAIGVSVSQLPLTPARVRRLLS